ncbi:4-amino-4-deoxy-L-arabinose-phosphoundecaprenol flippase subunit ArnF [Agarivorans gilvus]|jgi:undecaprenyl phosphate-alpha-L-ara4N flippase subunit ArnF|uniref:Probable 4-amino-4-deoxy-L-arabinose-phosphoundecaprenol flippase subunit ArnF n=1 Tax=Agarivorans gilvus TaxID=680279 RepID=A0ABQ1I441_9ALTE|nr:4-amino-4-deoxy-L-arabinose-phosphoundecaprenol flippase subunit ArnF [Agarivorans gilvus]GGB12661.1 putative 4-amino-4-deoxy-L-arabinose-phosphoundecaprenol flippase subunit ArnF [Agarivorans gilvus]
MAITRRGRSIALALLSVAFISLAQLSMKWGMSQLNEQFPTWLSLWQQQAYSHLVSHYWPYYLSVIGGLSCYASSMFCWVIALKRLALSIAYPLLSLSYVVVYLAAVSLPWIGESFSWSKALGVLLILIGIYLVIPRATGKQ